MAAVRVLGVDPGTVVAGFACLEVRARRPRVQTRAVGLRAANVVAATALGSGPVAVLEAGAVRLSKRGAPIEERLRALLEALEDWVARYRPDELALEEAFAGKSVQSALRIGEARGVVLAHACRAGLAVHEYPPARIKRCVAGHGGASKEAVAAFALKRLGIKNFSGPADASDALAVALCHLEERSRPRF